MAGSKLLAGKVAVITGAGRGIGQVQASAVMPLHTLSAGCDAAYASPLAAGSLCVCCHMHCVQHVHPDKQHLCGAGFCQMPRIARISTAHEPAPYAEHCILLLQSIAEAYAAEGATVVLTARSEDQLAEASPLEMHHCITCMRVCRALLHHCWSRLVRAAACVSVLAAPPASACGCLQTAKNCKAKGAAGVEVHSVVSGAHDRLPFGKQ